MQRTQRGRNLLKEELGGQFEIKIKVCFERTVCYSADSRGPSWLYFFPEPIRRRPRDVVDFSTHDV